MLASPERAPRTATDLASPELVLVDGRLGAHARADLAEPDDTLLRIERDIAFRRLVTRDAWAKQTLEPEAVPARSARRPPPKLVAAASVTVALVAALLLGVNVDLRGTPAGADSFELETTPKAPTTLTPSTTAETSPPAAPPAKTRGRPKRSAPQAERPRVSKSRTSAQRPRSEELTPRRFAWAPVSGATGYRVEFFRGDDLVYSAVVPGPHLALAPRWTFRGRRYTLAPGTYRWYVWPVRSGRRDSQATVQAELSVR